MQVSGRLVVCSWTTPEPDDPGGWLGLSAKFKGYRLHHSRHHQPIHTPESAGIFRQTKKRKYIWLFVLRRSMQRQLHGFLLFLSIIFFIALLPAVAADTQGSAPLEVKSDNIGSFFGVAPFDPLQGSHKESWNSKMWEDYGDGMEQEWSKVPDPELHTEEKKKINEWRIKAYKMTLQKFDEERKPPPEWRSNRIPGDEC